MTHEFIPHRKYPWFCSMCGYPAHEQLKHGEVTKEKNVPRPPCDHKNYRANVIVNRLEDVGLNYAEVTISCDACGAPAVFRGLKLGLSPNEPRAEFGNQEVRLPFICEGDPEPKPSMGFDVHIGEIDA